MTHQRNLIPCPFCGGDADISMITSNSVIRFMGFCKECGAMGKMERTEEEAARSWNIRVCGQEVEAKTADLKAAISTELNRMADRYNQVAIMDEFRIGGYLCSVKRIKNFIFPILDKIMAEIRESAWHTEIPTEDGDYIVAFKMSDNSIEYGWCRWDGIAWDIMCDQDPNNCEIVGWQLFDPFKERKI